MLSGLVVVVVVVAAAARHSLRYLAYTHLLHTKEGSPPGLWTVLARNLKALEPE
jgi:hypothetical protein